MPELNRIMIIGASGAGKTTLARALGHGLGLPVVHIDKFFFHPGWIQRDRTELHALIDAAAAGPAWVFEGNNSSSWDRRAERADLIIYLELGRVRRLARCLWRSARTYGQVRPDMADGCPEQFDRDFLFDWVWNYDTHSAPKAEALLARWAGKRPILRLSRVRDVRKLARDPHGELARLGVE